LDKPDFPFPQPSDGKDALFAAITKAGGQVFENPAVMLGMSPASSDGEFLRREGVVTYGIGAPSNAGETGGRPHGVDEYIDENAFAAQIKFFFNTVFNFTAPDKNIADYIE